MASLYFSQQEADWWKANRHCEPAATLRWTLHQRAEERAAGPGLIDAAATVDWWHLVLEYVAEAAMSYRLQPNRQVGRWLASTVEEIVHRDEEDWIGPWFRRRTVSPPQGYLETAHVCIAVAAAIDLAPEAFTESQLERARAALRERGVPLCTHWLNGEAYFNQRTILAAGLGAAAVIGGDAVGIERAMREFELCIDLFEPDGSYGESSQYASYAAWGMTILYETLIRHDPALADRLSARRYARCMRWWATNLLYLKPLSGWGSVPRARMVNFNDSGAIAAPHGDVLLHIAARVQDEMPEEAALARWLFDLVHLPALDQGPFDRASFGFVPRPSFLAPSLFVHASAVVPQRPGQLGMAPLQAFSNGDAIVRDAWEGQTVLATRGGGTPVHVLSHQHPDLNSFILTHRDERLLLDAGHACYRGLSILSARNTSEFHNTCTFSRVSGGPNPPELATQTIGPARRLVGGCPEPPVRRGGRRLLAERQGAVTLIGSEIAEVYGPPLRRFARFWVLAGAHALFIIDHIVADEPVRVRWSWLLNNRDGQLRLKQVPPDRFVARRGAAGMKLFHVSENLAPFMAMKHACVHDAYHPRPDQQGEGRPDSGRLVQFEQRDARAESLTVHAIAMDGYGRVAGWHLRTGPGQVSLEGPDATETWTLRLEGAGAMVVLAEHTGAVVRLTTDGQDRWTLKQGG